MDGILSIPGELLCRQTNRVDQSVPLWLVLAEPQGSVQGSVPSLNQSITNGIVWRTIKTLYTGYVLHAFGHLLMSTLLYRQIYLLSLGWAGFFFESLLFGALLVGLLRENPSRYITTLVIIVIVVAPIGPGSTSQLVFQPSSVGLATSFMPLAHYQ